VSADLSVGQVEPLEVVGEEPEVHPHPRHHAASVGAQQGSVVPSLDPGQVLGASVDTVGHPAQHVGALGPRQCRPGREGAPGGQHRGVHLGLAAGGHLRDRLLVDGGDIGEGFGRGDPLTADPVPGVDGDSFDCRPDLLGSRHR
jgi:hypothetical protein